MGFQVQYSELKEALEQVFGLQMELIKKDAEICALQFELELAKRIQESIGHMHLQMLSAV